MITDEELNVRIDQVCDDFVGQLDDLYAVIGMVVMGRRYGARVVRLVAPRRHWRLMQDLFGDYHELFQDEGRCAEKCLGFRVLKAVGGYWKAITGVKGISAQDRKAATNISA